MAARRTQWQNPLPNVSRLAFRYIDGGFSDTLTSGGVYQSTHVFRGNGLYDPDYTGVGVQPYGYDQWVAVYGTDWSANVYSSSIAVNWAITSATASQVKCYVIPYRNTTFDYTDNADLRVMRYCRWKETSKETGITRKNWMRSYCTTRMLYPNMSVKDADFTAGAGGSPPKVWYWHIIFDSDSVAEEIEITYDVKIKYYTKVARFKNVNES